MGGRKGWHLRLSVSASLFNETGGEWDFPMALCVCSLSRLLIGRQISWSRGNNLSLGKICAPVINGVNRNDGIYIMVKEHKRLHPYLFPSN